MIQHKTRIDINRLLLMEVKAVRDEYFPLDGRLFASVIDRSKMYKANISFDLLEHVWIHRV